MSKMVNFDFEHLEQKCKKNNITVYDAGILAGMSKTYFVTCRNNGNKVNNSALSRFYEKVRHLSQNESETETQLSFDFKNLDTCVKKDTSKEEILDELSEDRKLVEEYGYEKICRLYSLANFLKEIGYIGG